MNMIPVFEPLIEEEEIEAVVAALRRLRYLGGARARSSAG